MDDKKSRYGEIEAYINKHHTLSERRSFSLPRFRSSGNLPVMQNEPVVNGAEGSTSYRRSAALSRSQSSHSFHTEREGTSTAAHRQDSAQYPRSATLPNQNVEDGGMVSPLLDGKGRAYSRNRSTFTRSRSLRAIGKFFRLNRKKDRPPPYAGEYSDSTINSPPNGYWKPETSSQGSLGSYMETMSLPDPGRPSSTSPILNGDSGRELVIPGLCGIQNHGNTCYVNAVVQCLSNTDSLAHYFLTDQYVHDLRPAGSKSRKFGTEGELTYALVKILRAVWFYSYRPALSKEFHSVVLAWSRRADGTGFSAGHQHDAQEFLVWLLDKCHEDLNAGTKKRWKLPSGKSSLSEDVYAYKQQQRFMEVHRSYVLDLFQAQFRSAVQCPLCDQSSVTFEPYTCVSLSLPQNTNKALFVVMVYHNRHPRLLCLGLNADISASFGEVKQCLVQAAKVDAAQLILCEDTPLGVQRTFREDQPLSSLGNASTIYAVEVPYVAGSSNVVDPQDELVIIASNRVLFRHANTCEKFGNPICVRVRREISFEELHAALIGAMKSQMRHAITHKDVPTNMYELRITGTSSLGEPTLHYDIPMPLYVQAVDDALSLLTSNSGPPHLKLALDWSEKLIERYFVSETVFEHVSANDLRDEMLSPVQPTLQDCLKSYAQPEWVAFEGWKCKNCHMLPSHGVKSIQFWSLPSIMVIHLKRFKQLPNGSHMKLESLIRFPLLGLDMGPYLVDAEGGRRLRNGFSSTPRRSLRGDSSTRHEATSEVFDLFAVCNHHGVSLNSGHYTAHCRNPVNGLWYHFDDEKVKQVNEDRVVTKDAYLLFYERTAGHQSRSSVRSSTESGFSEHWFYRYFEPRRPVTAQGLTNGLPSSSAPAIPTSIGASTYVSGGSDVQQSRSSAKQHQDQKSSASDASAFARQGALHASLPASDRYKQRGNKQQSIKLPPPIPPPPTTQSAPTSAPVTPTRSTPPLETETPPELFDRANGAASAPAVPVGNLIDISIPQTPPAIAPVVPGMSKAGTPLASKELSAILFNATKGIDQKHLSQQQQMNGQEAVRLRSQEQAQHRKTSQTGVSNSGVRAPTHRASSIAGSTQSGRIKTCSTKETDL